jgi:hypothetical protein
MKPFIFLIFIATAIAFASCEKNTERKFPFEAVVLGRNADCGIFAIKFTDKLDQVMEIAETSYLEDVYIAKNLPDKLQTEGLSIVLNIRKIEDPELGACTDMGPGYPWIYVLSAKKKD